MRLLQLTQRTTPMSIATVTKHNNRNSRLSRAINEWLKVSAALKTKGWGVEQEIAMTLTLHYKKWLS